MRLSNRLQKILVWVQGNKNRKDVKEEALKRAKRELDWFFDLLLGYTYRTRILRDLNKPIIQLDQVDVDKLRVIIKDKLKEFEKVVDDALK